MKTPGRIIAGAIAVVGIAGGVYLNEQGPTKTMKNLTFWEYTNVDKPNTTLIFDDKEWMDRRSASQLVAYGNPEELDLKKLERGEKYDVEIRHTRWVGLGTIESITPAD